MKQTIITALLSIIFGAITASADIVKGRVVDSETKEPLPEAQMTYKQSYGGKRHVLEEFQGRFSGLLYVLC